MFDAQTRIVVVNSRYIEMYGAVARGREAGRSAA